MNVDTFANYAFSDSYISIIRIAQYLADRISREQLNRLL